MSETVAATIDGRVDAGEQGASEVPARTRVAALLEPFIFYALLAVLVLSAVPFGTVQPWWKAVFQCAVFALGWLCVIEGVIEGKLSRRGFGKQHRLLLPLVALVAFILVQAYLPVRSRAGGAGLAPISFAPYDTKMAALQLMALILAAGLLIQFTSNKRRLTALICTVIVIGVGSTLFGYARLAFQTKTGFLLPHLQPNDGSVSRGIGFAQFINYNHFAFLGEMTLGLVLGLTLRRPIKLARLAVGLVVAIGLGIAVVYSGSRSGIVSMVGQVLFIALTVFVAGPVFGNQARQLSSDNGGGARARRIGALLVTRVILIGAFLVMMVVGIVWVGGDPLAARLESVSKEFEGKGAGNYSNTMRAQIWPASWQLAKDNPIAGVGVGAYWIAITKSHNASGEFTPQQAHNDYLEILASAGVIGVACCIWFIVLFLKELTRRARDFQGGLPAHVIGALAGIFAVALHSVTDFGLHVTINSVLFMLLIVIAINPVGYSEKPTGAGVRRNE